jgi:hypothetical protein
VLLFESADTLSTGNVWPGGAISEQKHAQLGRYMYRKIGGNTITTIAAHTA